MEGLPPPDAHGQQTNAPSLAERLLSTLPWACCEIDHQLRFVYANRRAETLLNGQWRGLPIGAVLPAVLGGECFAVLGRALANREASAVACQNPATGSQMQVTSTPTETGTVLTFVELAAPPEGSEARLREAEAVGSTGSRQSAVLSTDIAKPKDAEEKQAFLLKLSDALRFQTDATAAEATVTALVLEHFRADRCYYGVIAGDDCVISRDAFRSGLPSVVGTYRLSDFALFKKAVETGVPIVVPDAATSDVLDTPLRELCLQLQVVSFVDVPVVKGGRVASVLCLVQARPRHWTAAEIELIVETAERTWVAVERARAEQALRESEQRLQALIQHMPGAAVFIVDQDLRYLLAEGEALSGVGLTTGDLVGKTIFEALPPALSATYGPLYRQALAGEGFAFEHQAHGGSYISRGTPLYSAQGNIYAVLAVSYDITQRKRDEEALRKSEEQFRLLVMASSDTVYRMSPDWEQMHCLAGKTFLVNTENPCSDWLDLYIPAEDQPDVRAAVQRAIDTKTPFELEHRVIQADGQLGWTFSRAVPLLDGNGEITEWLGAASNITLRRQAETQLREFNALLEAQMAERTEALQENKDLLQSVLDTSLISMVVLKAVRDENGNMTDFYTRLVNKQLERETGRTDLVGKLYAEQFPGLRPTGVFDLMRRVMDTGNPEGMEYHYAHEGLDKWYSSLFVKLDDGLVATHLDITERKQAEAELNKQYELLRQAEDVARMGSWEYDIASGAFHWSEGMYRLFGLPLNSPISVHTYLAFAVDEDRPVAERIVRRLHDTHRPFEETLRIQVEDQLVTLKIKAVVLHDSQQRPVRILGVDVDISELKRLEQEKLDIKLGQQKQLLIAILDAQEEERRRVAESLHNGVGQILYATKLHLERVGRLLPTDTPAGQALQTTDSLLSEAIEETRRVSHELMPVSLKDFGIAAALHDLCRKYQGSALRLDCRVAVFRQRLESHLELALYRISQELITNIVRHSEASEASIVLKKQGNHLLLRVIDNGRGFAYDPERTRGLGLRATTDRVKLLGGTFSVSRTERGLGTVVTVRIPAD